MRQKQQNKEAVRSRFQDIKLRVTQDMLEEFQKEGADITKQLDDGKKEQTTLEEAAKDLQSKVDSKKSEADACQGGQVRADKLCNAEEPKAEAPKEEVKAEAPKQEEAQAEAPKQEAQAEAPKQEAQAEAPKQEEAKAEAPKKR
ncbi:hypothetical protein INR49_005531 [Caranx melampygus]|nr:hypothetical protein INR49_005531 [Caranx melampygus]